MSRVSSPSVAAWLPQSDVVKVAEIRCEDKNGVLTIHIPKTTTEKAKPKQIKVD